MNFKHIYIKGFFRHILILLISSMEVMVQREPFINLTIYDFIIPKVNYMVGNITLFLH